MENYFNYFTEVEEHFQKRRGTGLLLSTLDWALIETWKDAGIPIEAVLGGIDAAFDQYERRPPKTRKVNSLAYEARGFQSAEIVAFLRRNAAELNAAKLPQGNGISAKRLAQEIALTLRELATDLEKTKLASRLEDLERRLTVMEDKLFAVLLTITSDDEIVAVRAKADRELVPYRRKMPGVQIEQLQKQYVHKRLLERYGLPRLSLFYM